MMKMNHLIKNVGIGKFKIYFMCLIFVPNIIGQSSVSICTPKALKFKLKELNSSVNVSDRLNPFYLRGDFDGDGQQDYAVLVNDSTKGQNGIAIFLGKIKKPFILGAGVSFHGMKDVDFDSWYVYGKRKVIKGVGEAKIPTLIGEANWIEWAETASALIYWNGSKFIWYQQGD
jgi:hypothetical protein